MGRKRWIPTRRWCSIVALIALLFLANQHNQVKLSLQWEEQERTKSRASPSSENSLHNRYQLAYDQSFGFFDDIDEDRWKRLQNRHVQQFPNHLSFPKDGSKLANEINSPPLWYASHFEPEFTCEQERRVGKLGDGAKWVCDIHRIPKEDCLVYSFGCDGKIQFEQHIKELRPDCEIHTFDVIKRHYRGDFATLLKNYSTFHHFGLAHGQGNKRGKQFYSLADIVKMLGHENRSIEMLKIDCEHCEYRTFQSWFEAPLRHIRQILLETHDAPMPQLRNLLYFLHDKNYVIFSKESNYLAGGNCVEWGFLKLHPSFFLNGTLYSQRFGNYLRQ
jgi:hypothetical protein